MQDSSVPNTSSASTAAIALDGTVLDTGSGTMEERTGGRRGRLRRWVRDGLARLRLTRSAPPAVADADLEQGLIRIMRSSESWLMAESALLEKDAIAQAYSAAAANLPRIDVEYDSVPEESRLASRCRGALHEWAERVRTSVQDAIEASARRAGAQLTAYEHVLGSLDGTTVDLRDTHAELRAAELAAESGQAQLEVRASFARWKYVLLIGLLVLVDWVANVPVFSELLPKDPGADAAWRVIVAESENMGLWGGVYRMGGRALHNIDASLLALGVIVFLVFLAHVFGESLRRTFSHSSAETPSARPTIRAQRRQFGISALLSFVGIAGVIGVLWLARAQLEATTALRVAETEARIAAVQTQLAQSQQAQDLVEVGALQQQVEGLRVMRDQRSERAEYALIISSMNLPILLLNIVLAIAAAVAGYLVTRDSIRGALHSPRSAALRQRLQSLRTDANRQREAIARLDAAVAHELAMARYLASTQPLRGWQSRADRLSGVLSTFRAENARRRGIDAANIAAFRDPPRLDFGTIDDAATFATPPELTAHREQHTELRARAATVLGRLQNETPGSADA